MSPLSPIPTPVVFPFEPDGSESLIETIAFKTDVLTSHQDNEQRIALRRRPSIRLKYRLTALGAGDAGRLAGLLWKTIANRWYVPLWQHAQLATNIAAGVYTVAMLDARYEFSNKALVWLDSGTWDLMTVTAIGPTSVTLAGATTFAHVANVVWVIPVGVGSMTPQYDLTRIGNVAGADVEFELDTTGVPNIGALAPTQLFKGAELLTIHPDTVDGSQPEHWVLSSERSGEDLGPFVYRPYGTSPVIARQRYWVLENRVARRQFRQWLETRRGRRVPLWVATYQDDFVVLADAAAGAGFLSIAAVDFANKYFGSTARVHIVALQPNRTLLPMTVDSVGTSAPGTEQLFLHDPLAAAVSAGTRLSLLVYARLTEDAVALEHYNSEVSVVTLGFTELPRETPA